MSDKSSLRNQEREGSHTRRTHTPVVNLDAANITKQFCELLSDRRLNELTNMRSRLSTPAHSSRTPAESNLRILDPCHHTLHNIPKIPVPPAENDPAARRFCHMLNMLSFTPEKYENPGLLDEALGEIPLQQIYDQAEDDNNIAIAQAQSAAEERGEGEAGARRRIKWGYQDYVIQALLKWFKTSFMTWVNNPACSQCGSPTVGQGVTQPTADDKARGASKVELYKCSDSSCNSFERFPRYGDVWAIMRSRRGRNGEWANCFTMLCRAMGSKVRWVWNSEDHTWTEVWSDHARRWVHVDACEGAFDQPRMYCEGWGRKLGYCIAFGVDSVTDVTRRYVRSSKFAEKRNRCPEEVLLWMLSELRRKKRSNLDKHEQARLSREDAREEKELRTFFITPLIADIEKLTLSKLGPVQHRSPTPPSPSRPAPQRQAAVPARKPVAAPRPQQNEDNKVEERAPGSGVEQYQAALERARRQQQGQGE